MRATPTTAALWHRPGPRQGIGAPRRRLLLAAGAVLSLRALPAAGRTAPAAPGRAAPAFLVRLDTTAMQLFDAALSGGLLDTQAALSELEGAARALDGAETRYAEAGGALSRFYSVNNRLRANLVDARAAVAVHDRRWLASVTEDVVACCGELSEPFAPAAGSASDIEVLAYEVRRMRTAFAWDDIQGLDDARREFAQRWQAARGGLAVRQPAATRAVERAMATAFTTTTAAALRGLYEAVRMMR